MNTSDKKQEKPDLLKQMASVVGHEMRNPLAIISNSIYFIKSKLSAGGAALDPKIAKHIGIIEGEVKQSNEIIEQMFFFTRPREMRRTHTSINAVIKDLPVYYQFPPSVTVKVVPDPADPRADIDVETICKACRYVLDNAAQAMPEGGTVTIEASHDDKCARITVTDSGTGLPDGDGEQVFTPFFTTKPRGLGLGLPIVRKFLELHGGTATAENAAARGARFTLTLPRLP